IGSGTYGDIAPKWVQRKVPESCKSLPGLYHAKIARRIVTETQLHVGVRGTADPQLSGLPIRRNGCVTSYLEGRAGTGRSDADVAAAFGNRQCDSPRRIHIEVRAGVFNGQCAGNPIGENGVMGVGISAK